MVDVDIAEVKSNMPNMKRVPITEQAPKVRAANFKEVCLGYTKEEAMEEASRCLNCKNVLKKANARDNAFLVLRGKLLQ